MTLNKFYLDELIKTALLEDINYCDVTTDYLIPENQQGRARFVSKADGIVCGTEAAVRVFSLLDDSTGFEILKHDGDNVKKRRCYSHTDRKNRRASEGRANRSQSHPAHERDRHRRQPLCKDS